MFILECLSTEFNYVIHSNILGWPVYCFIGAAARGQTSLPTPQPHCTTLYSPAGIMILLIFFTICTKCTTLNSPAGIIFLTFEMLSSPLYLILNTLISRNCEICKKVSELWMIHQFFEIFTQLTPKCHNLRTKSPQYD